MSEAFESVQAKREAEARKQISRSGGAAVISFGGPQVSGAPTPAFGGATNTFGASNSGAFSSAPSGVFSVAPSGSFVGTAKPVAPAVSLGTPPSPSGVFSPSAFSSGQRGSIVGITPSTPPTEGKSQQQQQQETAAKIAERMRSLGIGQMLTPGAPLAVKPAEEKVEKLSSAPLDVPRRGLLQCFVLRDTGSLKTMMNPKYSLFTTRGETFLLAGRKRANKQTSNYLISIDAEDLERDSKSFFGKVRSNVSGTEFVIYNNGCKPGEERPEGPYLREELGAVLYETNLAGTKGPRKMTVILPVVNSDDSRKRWQPRSEDDGLIAEYRRNPESAELVVLVNKEPTWNEQLRSYQLNFHGRVTKPSVKNFQLCDAKQPGKVVMQFGKVEDSKFNLDFNHPVSPVLAFGICLTAFDNKLACQ